MGLLNYCNYSDKVFPHMCLQYTNTCYRYQYRTILFTPWCASFLLTSNINIHTGVYIGLHTHTHTHYVPVCTSMYQYVEIKWNQVVLIHVTCMIEPTYQWVKTCLWVSTNLFCCPMRPLVWSRASLVVLTQMFSRWRVIWLHCLHSILSCDIFGHQEMVWLSHFKANTQVVSFFIPFPVFEASSLLCYLWNYLQVLLYCYKLFWVFLGLLKHFLYSVLYMSSTCMLRIWLLSSSIIGPFF